MLIRTASAIVLLSGLASFGVPSAAADELPPTPAETSTVTAPAEEPQPAPTPEPSELPTSEVTTPEPQEGAPPTDDPPEPVKATGDDSPATGAADEALGEPTEATDQTPAEETSETQTVEEGVATAPAVPDTPIQAQATAGDEQTPLSGRALAAPVLNPLASIGDLNCADLTVPVTVDNSRSTGPVLITVDYSGLEAFELAAGATQVVPVSVSGGSVYIQVLAQDPSSDEWGSFSVLAFGTVSADQCATEGPRARIGEVNCSAFTVPITLDNSRSVSETAFRTSVWRHGPDPASEQEITLQAGEMQTLQIAVTEGSFWQLFVLAPLPSEPTVLAGEEFWVDCLAGMTTVSVGAFDCSTRTIDVTIDNSDVTDTPLIMVFGYEQLWQFLDESGVASGAIEVVRVGPIPRTIHKPVHVLVLSQPPQTTVSDGTLARRDVDLNCPNTAARPTVAVAGAKLPQTGGFNFALPLLGVALLASGAGLLALSGRRSRY
jgi:LPXTG-motif cell wall-anchored protein